VRFQGRAYTLMYRYNARVSHAAGAFNWRVAVGDTAAVADYGTGSGKLCMEQTDAEITWSQSTRITQAYVAKAFGKTAAVAPSKGLGSAAQSLTANPLRAESEQTNFQRLSTSAFWASLALILLTLPAIFSRDAFAVVFLALFALWWPVFSDMESDD
jgi:hypothetical protein